MTFQPTLVKGCGTATGYRNNCRCDACRLAVSNANRVRRAARPQGARVPTPRRKYTPAPRLSAAPLVPFLHTALRDVAGYAPPLRRDGTPTNDSLHRGISALSHAFEANLGGKAGTYARYMIRVLIGEWQQITFHVADQLACGLGIHPILIWGRDDWEQGIDLDEEEAA